MHLPQKTIRLPERRELLAFALSCVLTLPLQAQTAFDLPQLTQLLSQVKTGEATFKEKRTVDMLERTLESSGRLSFAAPDTFVRETLKPRQEKVAVVGNSVTMSAGSRSRTVPLDSVPEAAVIMEAIRGTLTGNRELLERHFNAAVSGSAQRWSLELVPIEPRLRELVRSVQLGGQQSQVREVTVTMSDGDRSVMTIEPMAAAAPKPAASAS
jgi:outer membrane lipoprotein-sorting protein